ncbi:Cytoplasmic polyadenylation element-binding protein-like protein [Sarcoptes scabiei]|uniref:Cytoplasmic polyadenylation element-binding protein-like protein n=1 Tax=Sarcoptes scabiei TaxID=52283 RepID=A0A132A6W6_SARSC|nr:Cytoplasmic polyadenylation element-binding protein-like protein [Sarcoptes scabiei]
MNESPLISPMTNSSKMSESDKMNQTTLTDCSNESLLSDMQSSISTLQSFSSLADRSSKRSDKRAECIESSQPSILSFDQLVVSLKQENRTFMEQIERIKSAICTKIAPTALEDSDFEKSIPELASSDLSSNEFTRRRSSSTIMYWQQPDRINPTRSRTQSNIDRIQELNDQYRSSNGEFENNFVRNSNLIELESMGDWRSKTNFHRFQASLDSYQNIGGFKEYSDLNDRDHERETALNRRENSFCHNFLVANLLNRFDSFNNQYSPQTFDLHTIDRSYDLSFGQKKSCSMAENKSRKNFVDKGARFALNEKFFQRKEKSNDNQRKKEYQMQNVNRCNNQKLAGLYSEVSNENDLFTVGSYKSRNIDSEHACLNDSHHDNVEFEDEEYATSRSNSNHSTYGHIHGLSSITPMFHLMTGQMNFPQLNKSDNSLYDGLLNENELDNRARKHREEASRVEDCKSIFSISHFEYKPHCLADYSVKVFLGGVPWDMNNDDMLEVFKHFGVVSIQRPGKDVRPSRSSKDLSKAGYLYLIFDESKSVNKLINVCKITFDEEGSKYIYSISSKHSKKVKNVQVIPWDKEDSVYYRPGYNKEEICESRIVFLGALHGMMNSKSIFEALERIFGSVDYVVLDTDRFDYPMGFGRAQFSTDFAYQNAIDARFVKVVSQRFKKTIQIDPYLEDQKCSQCYFENGPVYCFDCRHYFCRNCWTTSHQNDEKKDKHEILMKKVSNKTN